MYMYIHVHVHTCTCNTACVFVHCTCTSCTCVFMAVCDPPLLCVFSGSTSNRMSPNAKLPHSECYYTVHVHVHVCACVCACGCIHVRTTILSSATATVGYPIAFVCNYNFLNVYII